MNRGDDRATSCEQPVAERREPSTKQRAPKENQLGLDYVLARFNKFVHAVVSQTPELWYRAETD